MKLTKAAREYEPTGDPDHVAYGADYRWQCSCGRKSHYVTTERKAKNRASNHERYCDGETTVDVL